MNKNLNYALGKPSLSQFVQIYLLKYQTHLIISKWENRNYILVLCKLEKCGNNNR